MRPPVAQETSASSVLLTGGTGFVGRAVLAELLAQEHRVTALVRSPEKLEAVVADLDGDRVQAVEGTLFDAPRLGDAFQGCQAVIHLVGIIMETPSSGQTFDRIHRQGTQAVVDAAVAAGVRRFVHMSALGSRPEAKSRYHGSKWAGEEIVRSSGLDWTLFRPSIIHGPQGEFMELLKTFACGLIPPVMPYFGSGRARLQPVSVRDVAHCFVSALNRPETVGQTYDLGGPRTYSWRELYAVAKRLIPGARRWKPRVGQPVFMARLLAATLMKTPLVPAKLKFNADQVIMSQEDSVCDHTAVESAFGIKLRDFEAELSEYGGRIR
ncbi:MAG: NAD(P)H-binding protein [Planctomycetes bacterium]|nr:NAD(P)H-binding protein [Planctomycetota bacterium]